MARTVRINLLVSPEEKADIVARAKTAKMTTSELVRRAVVSYDPEVDMDELEALAEELAGVVARTEKKLDENLAAISSLREQLADEDALKAAVAAELSASGGQWPFGPSDPGKERTAI